MGKQDNIYDLVERASARHGIPRLQLWQEVAKALTENELRALNLSARLNPVGGPTIADWLPGFRAAVDRFNDPHSGMARILKHIIVRRADFERWLRKANRVRRGPQSGATGYQRSDRKMFPRIGRLIREAKAGSPYGAALILAREGRLGGAGAPESRAKRLAARYRKEYGGTDR